jgi:hypothetical protein
MEKRILLGGETQPIGEQVSYSSILKEHDVESAQRKERKLNLEALSADELNDGPGPHGAIGHVSRWSLSSDDIGILADCLLDLGDVNTLNLVLESPGGDGMQVEKFVSLCRSQCKRFRVIIPNEAKSAATLISLGADEIAMGPTSELGPIDAQIPAIVAGMPTYISAQSFIDARDNLLSEHARRLKTKESVEPILQQMMTLDLPFIAECERMMEFGREVGKKLLCDYMFKGDSTKTVAADNIVKELSSVERFKVHGRRIDGQMARTLGLNIRLCGHDDKLWSKAFEYYRRANIALGRHKAQKLFETKHEQFVGTMVES